MYNKIFLITLFTLQILSYINNISGYSNFDSNVTNNVNFENSKTVCLMEGDIVCPKFISQENNVSYTYYMTSLDKNRLWLTRVIPYFLDKTYTESEVNSIKEAISDLESKTCVKFRLLSEHPNDEDYVWIKPIKGCYSSIGRTTGKQDLSLTPDCLTVGKGTIIHELIHSLGIWHEHTRPDRDTYIYIYSENIISEAVPNFRKRPSNLVDLLDEPYDYYSIMHYGRYDFSIDPNNLPTLWPLDSKIDLSKVGQRLGVSDIDKKKLDKLYKCDITHCPDPPSLNSGTIHGTDFSVGSKIDFECNSGLTLIGSSQTYCRYDGKWSGRQVSCIDKLHHYCNFETVGNEMCGWTEVTGSDFKWQRRSGATPDEDTGPLEDYTYETIRGHYIFMETSAPQLRGDKAKISTPVMSKTSSKYICITFAHYMWGQKLGTLGLYINEPSFGDKMIWEESDNQGPQWNEVRLLVEQKESFSLIFEGIVGAKGTSDIALDEILLVDCDQSYALSKGFKFVRT